jgi:hypothetical protein
MIRIRCSGSPPGELELAGTQSELSELRDTIVHFCKLKRPLLEVPVEQTFDPAPYERRLLGLRLVRTARKIQILLEGDRLLVTGRLDLLELFARSLPCEVGQTPASQRFDAVDRAEQVDAGSLGIVLTALG